MFIINILHLAIKIIQIFMVPGRLLFPNPCINTKSFTNKYITMKKLLTILAIGAFAACNGSSSSTTTTDSTTVVKTDSAATTVTDSTKMAVDSTKAAMKDSVKVDTTKAK
jgi:uncharacterized lipoprotein YajG